MNGTMETRPDGVAGKGPGSGAWPFAAYPAAVDWAAPISTRPLSTSPFQAGRGPLPGSQNSHSLEAA